MIFLATHYKNFASSHGYIDDERDVYIVKADDVEGILGKFYDDDFDVFSCPDSIIDCGGQDFNVEWEDLDLMNERFGLSDDRISF